MKPINNLLFSRDGEARFFEKIQPKSVEIFLKTGGLTLRAWAENYLVLRFHFWMLLLLHPYFSSGKVGSWNEVERCWWVGVEVAFTHERTSAEERSSCICFNVSKLHKKARKPERTK